MGDGGQTPASMLNKILQGKITLKEDSLDIFGFEAEETERTIEVTHVSLDEVKVTQTVTNSISVNMDRNKVTNLSMFEIDEEFMKELGRSRKKKANLSLGQVGFILD